MEGAPLLPFSSVFPIERASNESNASGRQFTREGSLNVQRFRALSLLCGTFTVPVGLGMEAMLQYTANLLLEVIVLGRAPRK